MGVGYIRVDVSNNIADGNIIQASDLDGEFDGIVAAFAASTGHTHDGTQGEGGPVSIIGPNQEITVSAGVVTPSADNTIDLGSAAASFASAWFDGTVTIADLVLSATATFAGATIADLGTVTTANIDGGTLDGVVIGGVSAAAATFTTLTATGTSTLTTVDINGGAIDGTVIGASTPAAADFTTMDTTGNVNVGGTLDVTGNLTLSSTKTTIVSTRPLLVFDETDGTSTHNEVHFVLNSDIFSVQTRDNTGSVVSTDYQITRGASGATDHSFLIANSEVLGIDSTGIAVTGTTLSGDGTVSLPGFAFTGDTDSGMYRIGANDFAFAANGVIKLEIAAGAVTAHEDFRIQDGTAASPGLNFDNDGDSGFYRKGADNIAFAVNGSEIAEFTTLGLGVAGAVGAVGFATGISGGAGAPVYTFEGDTDTGMYSTGADVLAFTAGGTQRLRLESSGATVTGQLDVSAGVTPATSQDTLSNYLSKSSFTPGVSFGGGTTGITYTTQTGTYTRVGDLVLVTGQVTLSNKGTSTGIARITGLPFAMEQNEIGIVMFEANASSIAGNVFMDVDGGADTNVPIRERNASGTSNLNDTNFNNTTSLTFFACYHV